MTVIVGILCSDGVVIGSDSTMVAGRLTTGYTIERQEGDVLKIEVIGDDTITAVTGAMGLGQRFNDQVTLTSCASHTSPPSTICLAMDRSTAPRFKGYFSS